MSISKLRSRRGILTRQEHVKSPKDTDEEGNSSSACTRGISVASDAVVDEGTGTITATATATPVTNNNAATPAESDENANVAHKTATKPIASIATTKLQNAAAINAAVVAAATLATINAKQQLKQQQQQQYLENPVTSAKTNLPQTSLLKIEPFVPSLTTRLRRRPLERSYTTLTSNITNNKTATTTALNAARSSKSKSKLRHSNTPLNSPLLVAAIESNAEKTNAATRQRRNPLRAIIKRQRSKSTSSSVASHRRPATAHRNFSPHMPLLNGEESRRTAAAAAANTTGDGCASGASSSSSGNGNEKSSNNNNNGAIITLQPNGICRIIRSAEEREKQPDRINYDRRGLGAIPLFEGETQLRLLSLQHNLINIFHIPKGELIPSAAAPAPPPSSALQTTSAPGAQMSNVPLQSNPLAVMSPQAEARHSPDALLMANSIGTVRQKNGRHAAARISGSASKASSGVGAGLCLSLALTTTTARQLRSNALTPSPSPPPTTPLTPMQALPHAALAPPQIYQQLLQQRLSSTTSISSSGGSNSTKSLHFNAPLLPLPRQPTPSRFALKRSKSFLTQIPRHLENMQKNMLKTQLARARLAAAGADVRLSSFDSSSVLTDSSSSLATCATANTNDSNRTTSNSNGTTFPGSEYAEDDPLRELAVKNRQLVASYGTTFQYLVFLDLYDNQIERIGNLDGLPVLSVLLLGKNRITDLSGLNSLKLTLRVLDLHGNKITNIAHKLNCLVELKSLNLAGNLLRQIGAHDFEGLQQLRELNLKRNKIKRINGFQYLTALERLWLCNNELHRVDDMTTIAKASNLLEITIDNNPVSLAGDCVSFLVSHLPRLQSLTHMPITEQVRVAAMSWRRNKEISDTQYAKLSPDAYQSIKREEVISNARTNWELLRSQQMGMQKIKKAMQQTNGINTPRIAKPSELSRINESNEAMREAINEGGGSQEMMAMAKAEYDEHIKLPPIQQQDEQQKHGHNNESPGQMTSSSKLNPAVGKETPAMRTTTHGSNQQPQIEPNNNADSGRLSGSSGSSLGPNVHSSSSCFSSDNEDSTELKLQQNGTRLHKYQKRIAGQKEHRHSELGERRKDNKNTILRSTNSARQNANGNARKTNGVTDTTRGERNALAEEQVCHKTTEQLDDATDCARDANRVTAKQTRNDTNQEPPTQQRPQPNQENTLATTETREQEQEDDTGKACEAINLDVAENNSTTILKLSRTSTKVSRTMTMIPLEKLTTASEGHTTATQSASASNSSGSGSSNSSQTTSTLQQPTSAQTDNHAGNAIATRATCRRLMRSQTVVHTGATVTTNNQCTPAAVSNSGAESAGGAGSRRGLQYNQSKSQTQTSGMEMTTTTTTTTPANGQPTVTCIIAPTPLSAANNNNNTNCSPSNSNASSLLSVQSGGVPNKAEREAREREQERQRERERALEREREREQGGDYLIEICGRYLNVYGQGALRYIDKQWNAAKASDVHTLNFSYINFNNIAATVLGRVKTRFPNAEHFVFRETNIEFIGQLNALAELQGITTLTIDPEGNPLTTKDLWREYAIYRLSHWGLKQINGIEVTEEEIEMANGAFESLADLVLWAMPDTMLQPLLARLRLDETCTASKMSPKEWLMKQENKSLQLVVGKEALQWKKSTSSSTNTTNGASNNSNGNSNSSNSSIAHHHQQAIPFAIGASSSTNVNSHNANINALSVRERGRLHFATMLENTVNAVEKMHALETLWPSMLLDIVRNALLDYAHLDEHLRTVIDEIMK